MTHKPSKYLSILALAGLISVSLTACMEEDKNKTDETSSSTRTSQDANSNSEEESTNTNAEPEASNEISESDIKARLENAFPQVAVDNVTNGPADLYEVQAGSQVIYTTKDGKYLFVGNLLDLENSTAQNPVNYTEMSRKKLRNATMAELDKNLPIEFKPENTKYTITVFTDIDCGYCRKFHENIKEMNDLGIAVRYISFPRAGINSKSYNKAVSVWCAEDRNAALTMAKKGQEVPEAKCDTHFINKQYELGMDIGISGTPAMLLDDGTLIPGYMPAKRLAALLDQIAKEQEKQNTAQKKDKPSMDTPAEDMDNAATNKQDKTSKLSTHTDGEKDTNAAS